MTNRDVKPETYEPGVWYDWSGGENPVPGRRVLCKGRSGRLWRDDASALLRWTNTGSNSDIIAFRLVEADQGSSADADTQPAPSFQSRVLPWLMECFGAEIAADRVERCDRFIEEALELAQSLDWPKERACALVDYVYGRPAGEPFQEVGGTMVTLAALCQAAGLDMDANGETELARIMQPEIVQKIRAKQAAKPTGSALPVAPSVPGEGHGTGWQPIETAPKDGESILAICATAYSPLAGVTWWQEGWTHYSRPAEKWHGGVGRWFPTHWMLLPPPPAASVSMGTSRKASEPKGTSHD